MLGSVSQFKVYIILGLIIVSLGGVIKLLYDKNATLEHNYEVTVQAYEHSMAVQEEVSFQEGVNHAESLSAKRIEERVKILKEQRGEINEGSVDNSVYSVTSF